MYKPIIKAHRIWARVLTLLLLFVGSLAQAQQGSQGNTTVFNNTEAALYGAHSFVTGGSGTQAGIIQTARTAPAGILSFGPAATHSDATDANHIDGYAGKYGTAAFTFPIGNGTKLRSVGISAPTASDFFKAAYWSANPNTATLPAGAPFLLANLGTGVTGVSNVEYWDIDGPSAVNITLSWDAASALGTLTTNNIANLIVVGYNPTTSKWESLGRAGGTTGTLAATGTITANGVTPNTYSAYTFGAAAVVPDLIPSIESTLSILSIGASAAITVYIENIKSEITTSAVAVTITKPSASSGLSLTVNPSADWLITETSASYSLTLTGSIAGFNYKLFTATLNRTAGSIGNYNFTPVIANNSGGETNNANNRASAVFTKN